MPPPTASLKPAPKAAAANKDKTPSTSTAPAPAEKGDKLAKPDQVAYNKEQDKINKEIDAVKEKLVSGEKWTRGNSCGSSWLLNTSNTFISLCDISRYYWQLAE